MAVEKVPKEYAIIVYHGMNHSPMLGHQLNSMGCNHHSHKCAFIEKHGNMEVGTERMGGEMGHEQ